MKAKSDELPTERPLVTFALFAYNQEKYVREAIEGAFSQTYSPIEIILSDDCSTDRTFEIMQEMAAAYQGHHSVKLNRNNVNQGIGNHLNILHRMSNGSFIVIAAGDDISIAERTVKLVESWQASRANFHLVYSDCEKIYNDGRKMWIEKLPSNYHLLESFIKGDAAILGAVCSWTRDCFSHFGELKKIHHEDAIMPFRAALLGTISYVEKPLVKYRVLAGTTVEMLGVKIKFRDWKTFKNNLCENLAVARRDALLRHAVINQKICDISKVPNRHFEREILDRRYRSVEQEILFFSENNITSDIKFITNSEGQIFYRIKLFLKKWIAVLFSAKY